MRTLSFDIEIPDWCNYVAQDADGKWYAFIFKPMLSTDCWQDDSGEYEYITRGSPSKNWKQELYKVT